MPPINPTFSPPRFDSLGDGAYSGSVDGAGGGYGFAPAVNGAFAVNGASAVNGGAVNGASAVNGAFAGQVFNSEAPNDDREGTWAQEHQAFRYQVPPSVLLLLFDSPARIIFVDGCPRPYYSCNWVSSPYSFCC